MISVCMATYNGVDYLKPQIDSILAQLKPNDELIISDDSSADGTTDLIKTYQDSRIKLLEKCNFHSPVLNFENALKVASGDYIFLSDQDDIWLPEKSSVMIRYLKDYDVVVSDCFVINNDGSILYESFQDLMKAKKGFIRNFVKNGYLGCCIAFSKEMLKFYLPFPKGIAMHDIWIGLITELVADVIFIPDKLILYRRHEGTLTSHKLRSNNSYTYRIYYRIIFALLVFRRFLKIKFSKMNKKFYLINKNV